MPNQRVDVGMPDDGSDLVVSDALNAGNECQDEKPAVSTTAAEAIFTSLDTPTPFEIGESPPPPPPNGGYGWVVSVAVAFINGHTWGLNSSYGVFLAHYLSETVFPGATALEYAFVGSLSVSCALGVSPLATVAVRELGIRPTMLFGAAVEAVSLVLASFATQIWHLFLTQGILFGIGMGFLFTPSVGVVPQWFTTRRSLANGIGACGSGLGGVVYSFAAGAMIEKIGLQWTFRVLGIVAFVVNTVCTLLIKDRNKIIGSRQLAFDLQLFKRFEYVLLLAFGWFSMLGYIVLIFSLANYARVIGLGASEAALVSALHNAGQAVGRPLVGYFSDRTGRLNIATLLTFVAGVFSLAIWINAKTYAVLICFAFIGGTVSGTFWATIAPVTAEVVGLQAVPSALSLMWLVILLPCTFSQPIAMQLVESTGSYLPTQIWTGLMYIVAAMCLCVIRGWKIVQVSDDASTSKTTTSAATGDLEANTDEGVNAGGGSYGGARRMLRECWKWKKV